MEQPESNDGLCSHEDLEFLGEDTSRNRYSRCSACESILIQDRVKVWVIRQGGPMESQASR